MSEKYIGHTEGVSHPIRVRGLKLVLTIFCLSMTTSHPIRVRGLKQYL